MFPVVVRLLLADFQDLLPQAGCLGGFFKKERESRCVYSRIGIRRAHFEGAVVTVESLAQEFFVVRVGTPLILIGATEDAQGFAILRTLGQEFVQDRLGAS